MIENEAAQPRKHHFRLLILWPVSIVLGAYVFVVATAVPIGFIGVSGMGFLLLSGVFGVIAGMIVGLLVGFSQRLLLPVRASWRKLWMPATFLGWTIGGTVSVLLWSASYQAFSEYPKKGLPDGLGIALSVGIMLLLCMTIGIIQGLFMQRSIDTHNWRSFWIWVRATAVGWVIGLLVYGLLAYVHSTWGLLQDLVTKMGGTNSEVARACPQTTTKGG